MSHVKNRALLHFVWTTWDRLPWIKPEIASFVHRCIPTRRSITETAPSRLTQNLRRRIRPLPSNMCPLQRIFGAQRLQRRALARRMSLARTWPGFWMRGGDPKHRSHFWTRTYASQIWLRFWGASTPAWGIRGVRVSLRQESENPLP